MTDLVTSPQLGPPSAIQRALAKIAAPELGAPYCECLGTSCNQIDFRVILGRCIRGSGRKPARRADHGGLPARSDDDNQQRRVRAKAVMLAARRCAARCES